MNSTIIKWPGGKKSEYKHIKDLIPEYNRYIEPFFGGGAIFFQEEPEIAIINDYNSLLMDFYRLVKKQDENFLYQLKMFEKNWDNLDKFISEINEKLEEIFKFFREGQLTERDIEKDIDFLLENNLSKFNGIFDEKFVVDIECMFNTMKDSVIAKIKRMKKIEIKKDKKLSREDIYKNLETGFRSGFYYHFRDLLNDCNLNRKDLNRTKHIAIFYFIREFCYGSMFRYNLKGEFNIPYGGISYNYKDFGSKIKKLYSSRIRKIFENTDIYDKDFAMFLKNINLSKNDFLFFDPPYDTDFSTYGGNTFDDTDHKRLADILEKLDAKFILIIKNTQFIDNLYKNRGLNIKSYDKLYSYNVRGRNDRETKHLIVTNY